MFGEEDSNLHRPVQGRKACRWSIPESCSGRGGSRTLKAYRSLVFETSAVAHRLALPLVFESTGGRNRTCELLLNREGREPALASPVMMNLPESRGGRIRTGDLLVPSQADCADFPTPRFDPREECPAGVEPALPPWQGDRLPLHHGHSSHETETNRCVRIVKETRGHRVGLEPTSPHYGCGVFAARRPVHDAGTSS